LDGRWIGWTMDERLDGRWIELSFNRRVRMEFGFDRLPTDQREGGKFTVASSPPAITRSLRPPCGGHPPPTCAFFLTEILYYIGNRISVGKRSIGYKTDGDETVYGVDKKWGLMICAFSVCPQKIEILFLVRDE
jgi:hypothetical protein